MTFYRKTFDNSDWAGTESQTSIVSLFGGDVPVTFRLINGLDVSVDVTVEGTDEDDDQFNRADRLPDASTTITVASGDRDVETLFERWDLLRFSVTPASNPSSGELLVRGMGSDR